MPTSITLVMAYYENPRMLQEHFRRIREMPFSVRDRVAVVVVDDGSPRNPARPEDCGAPLQIYRMKKDVRWNQDACRNVGVAHAETDWVLMTDMDHIVPEVTWRILTSGSWDPACAYSFRRVSAPGNEPYKPHPNSWMLNRRLFDAVGGYDERFAGLYGTDGDFKVRLLAVAKAHVPLKEVLIRVPREVIPDASTTTDLYLRKQPGDRPGVEKLRLERDRRGEAPLRGTFEYERIA